LPILSTTTGHIGGSRAVAPIEINLDCMEHATIDHIMDIEVKGTHQQRIQLYPVVKVGQVLHQGKWLTKGASSKEVSPSDGDTQRNRDDFLLRWED
jgi:hypothetical protein